MDYRTFQPSKTLSPFVKCYWTLEGTPSDDERKQRILPDGCIEMAFILGDDIRRYSSETEYKIQPRAMVLGQITEPFYIEPRGYVSTFSVRFYPHGFCSFVSVSLIDLADRDTPIGGIFTQADAASLSEDIFKSNTTEDRIEIVERFLSAILMRESTIDRITKMTVDLICASKGRKPVNSVLKNEQLKIRQIERNFQKYIGISPKKLGRAMRLQTALSMLLEKNPNDLTRIAYENGYFDQAHFIHDFKHFTGSTPREFEPNQELLISSLFSTDP